MTSMEKYAPWIFLILWSSGAIFVKLGLQDASVSVFLTIRSWGAATLIFGICIFMAWKEKSINRLFLPRHAIATVVALGLLIQVSYQSAFFLALYYEMTPGMLALLLGLQPLLVPLLARERVTRPGYLFLALGLIGLIIAVVSARKIGATTASGILFGLLSVLAISLGSVIQKKSKIDALTSALYQSLSAGVFFLIIVPFTPTYLTITPIFLLSAGWMIIVVSTLATLLLYAMLARHSASRVGILFYLVPVCTMIFDYLAFGNKISWLTIAGGMLVLMSVIGFGKTGMPRGSPVVSPKQARSE